MAYDIITSDQIIIVRRTAVTVPAPLQLLGHAARQDGFSLELNESHDG